MDEITINVKEFEEFVTKDLTVFIASAIDTEVCSFETGAAALQACINLLDTMKESENDTSID